MPRYEFSEGSSNKFWQIELDGSSFTTTYGRIGTDGQTTMKEDDSDAKAKKEDDKLVAEKVKKGYELVGDGDDEEEAPAPKKAAAKKKEEVFEDEGDEDEDEKPKKAAAKKGAAGSSKGSDGGGRYFEFSEGSSHKFWEIKLDGTFFTTRYGRIGTPGTETMKEYDSEEKAKKEHDKLVAEKVKKGYEEA